MPVLFTENGFHVTLCDTAYANYKWTADMSFYDGMDNVDAYTTIGRYSSRYNNIFGKEAVRVQTRNFFMYSVMKAMPVASQVLIYDEGDYFTTGEKVSFSETFINSYSVLCELPDMTRITDDSEGNYIFIDNESTHEITLLKTPEYEPGVTNAVSNYKPGSYVINGREMKMETERQISHYHVNMASFLKLGRWFEYLKKEGVYDNTRIIIVSDHGYGLGQFDYMVMPGMLDVQWYNSMLMVKDFGAGGKLVTDRTFMTSADTPYLAMEGLIKDMTNPFTGNPINMEPKKDKQLMTTSHNYSLTKNDGYSFDTSDGEWFSVHDDIFNIADWNREEAH